MMRDFATGDKIYSKLLVINGTGTDIGGEINMLDDTKNIHASYTEKVTNEDGSTGETT